MKITKMRVPTNEEYDKLCDITAEDNRKMFWDLYSAFLLSNTNPSLQAPDRSLCTQNYDQFISLHDNLIHSMKENHISRKSCFGF